MTYFSLLTLLVLGISGIIFVLGIFIGVCVEKDTTGNSFGGFLSLIGLLGTCIYLFFGVLIYGKHEMNADHYQSLLNKQKLLEQRIQENNLESIDVYKKDYDKIVIKIEKQRKAMSVKDWEKYYETYKESN